MFSKDFKMLLLFHVLLPEHYAAALEFKAANVALRNATSAALNALNIPRMNDKHGAASIPFFGE